MSNLDRRIIRSHNIPPAPEQGENPEEHLTEKEKYNAEKKRKQEQMVMHAILQYCRALKEKYGIPTRLEDGTTDMGWYTGIYDKETIERHLQYANMVKQTKTEKKPENQKNAEYLEKIVPISLSKTTDYFLSEINNPDKLYKRHKFTTEEREIYDQLLNYIPQDIIIQINALYDDVEHHTDFSINGDFPLCGIDVTTRIKITEEGKIEIAPEKLEEILLHNETSTSIFYGLLYDEKKEKYIPKESIANFPLLYLATPNTLIPDFIDKINPAANGITAQDLHFTKYIIEQLSDSLHTVQHKTHFDENAIARYMTKAETEIALPKGAKTVGKAMEERYECEDTLSALFYCMDQFLAKELTKKPRVELPQHLLK